MLLGALLDLDVDVGAAIAALDLDVRLTPEHVTRGGMRATHARIVVAGAQPLRTLAEVTAVIDGAALDPAVAARARSVFRRLAEAEARGHGVPGDDVDFHEIRA